MSDLDRILKEIKRIDAKLSNLRGSSSNTSSTGSKKGFDEYFIGQGAEAILYKRTDFKSKNEPELFFKNDLIVFEDFGFNKQEILSLAEEIKQVRKDQLSYNKNIEKLKSEYSDKIDHKNRLLEDKTDEIKSLETKINSFESISNVIDKTLKVSFIDELPDKAILLDLAIILNTITDTSMPDAYKNEISPQTQLISTLFHITFILCTLYSGFSNDSNNKLTLSQVNELIDDINSKINYYSIGQYPNDQNEFFDDKKHKTSANAAFKVKSYITLPIYLKGKETEDPAKRAIVLAE